MKETEMLWAQLLYEVIYKNAFCEPPKTLDKLGAVACACDIITK